MQQDIRIGLALGSGSARGWAHIGVIKALLENGIRPDVVAGTSVGAIIGAVHASGNLEGFERWVRKLGRRQIMSYLDVALVSGGFFEGKRLADLFLENFGDVAFSDLELPFAAVATELYSGRERWLTEGSVVEALRASVSLPGLFTPAEIDGRMLVDGGLVNPVPVSLCYALGADVVFAVNLNGDLVGRHLQRRRERTAAREGGDPVTAQAEGGPNVLDRITDSLKERASGFMAQFRQGSEVPGMFDVMATALNIMQDRITRSRMAGDPPDVVLSPRLSHIALLEFDRGAEAIEEGQASVNRMLPALNYALGRD
ncbi:patatin-like phospholipase family protein [Ectothiorhodospiraceae bacterium WFHF3C12]|nr:patatin-like phospholipase family protein [Ectothiorhodospiraceae bacterium WFHF3C12]